MTADTQRPRWDYLDHLTTRVDFDHACDAVDGRAGERKLIGVESNQLDPRAHLNVDLHRTGKAYALPAGGGRQLRKVWDKLDFIGMRQHPFRQPARNLVEVEPRFLTVGASKQ